MPKVIVVKSENEKVPVDVSDSQLQALVSTWGRENVLDAETLQPAVAAEPEPVAEHVAEDVATAEVAIDPQQPAVADPEVTE